MNLMKSNIKLKKNGIQRDKNNLKEYQVEEHQTSGISFLSVLFSSPLIQVILSIPRALQICMQMTFKFKSQALAPPLSSRLVYHSAFSASPFLCVVGIRVNIVKIDNLIPNLSNTVSPQISQFHLFRIHLDHQAKIQESSLILLCTGNPKNCFQTRSQS